MLNKKTQQLVFWSVIIVLLILCFVYPKNNEKYMSQNQIRKYRIDKRDEVKKDALKAGSTVIQIKKSTCMKNDKEGDRLGKELFNNYRRIYKRIHMFNEMMVVEVKNMSDILARINKRCVDKDPGMTDKINTLKADLNNLIQKIDVSELEIVSEITPEDEGAITILPVEPVGNPKPPLNQIQPREQTQTNAVMVEGGDAVMVEGGDAVMVEGGDAVMVEGGDDQEIEGMLI